MWNKTVAAVEHEQAAAMARHCRQEICHGNLACAATCLEHVMQVARAEAALDTWLACSTSPACSPSCRYLDIYTIYTIFWVSTLSTRYLYYLSAAALPPPAVWRGWPAVTSVCSGGGTRRPPLPRLPGG